MPGCPCNIRALHALKIRGATERTHASHRFAAGTGAENSAKSVGDDANPRHQGGASPFLLVPMALEVEKGTENSSRRNAQSHRGATKLRHSRGDPHSLRRQFHGLILRNDAQHRVSKDAPARNVVSAPWKRPSRRRAWRGSSGRGRPGRCGRNQMAPQAIESLKTRAKMALAFHRPRGHWRGNVSRLMAVGGAPIPRPHPEERCAASRLEGWSSSQRR